MRKLTFGVLGIVFGIVLGAMLAAPTLAQGSLADKLCTPPSTPANEVEVLIDLRNGHYPTGRTRFEEEETARLIFQNFNPFHYDYKIDIETSPIPEPGFDLFVSILAGPWKEVSEPPKGDEAEKIAEGAKKPGPVPPAVPVQGNACAEAVEETATQFRTFKKFTIQAGIKLPAAVANVASEGKALVKRGEAAEKALHDAEVQCRDLVRSAESFLNTTDIVSLAKEIGDMEKELYEFEALLGLYGGSQASFKATLKAAACTGSDGDSFREELAQAALLQSGLESWLKEAKEALKIAKNNLEGVEASRKSVQDILARQENFLRSEPVGGEPVEVHVVVRRRQKAEKDFPAGALVDKTLRFGSQRFILGVGVAFARLDSSDFGIEQGFARGLDGELVLDDKNDPVLGRVVSRKEGSNERITPTLILHTRLGPVPKFSKISGWYLSTGLTGNFENGGADVEYLAGLSLGLGQGRFFLTLGYYNGKVQSLRDGFYEGFKVPDDFTDSPVRKDRDWGFAWSFSLKAR